MMGLIRGCIIRLRIIGLMRMSRGVMSRSVRSGLICRLMRCMISVASLLIGVVRGLCMMMRRRRMSVSVRVTREALHEIAILAEESLFRALEECQYMDDEDAEAHREYCEYYLGVCATIFDTTSVMKVR
jgi:hypothetical protein